MRLRYFKKYYRNKLFITFYTYYMLMMLITVIVGSISYFVTVTAVRSSIEDYNQAMLQQAKTTLDEKIMSAKRLALQIAFNPYAIKISTEKSVDNSEDIYTISKLISTIKTGSDANDFVKGVYIYFPNSDIVVTNEGKFTADFFYNNVMPRNLTITEWKNLFMDKNLKGFRSVENVKYESGNSNILTYYYPLNTYNNYSDHGAVVVYFDKAEVDKLLEKLLIDKGAEVLIINEKGEIMTGGENASLYEEVKQQNIDGSSQYYANTKDGKVVITVEKSPRTHWQYISLVPMSTYYQKASFVKNIVIAITIIQLLIGVIMALIMSKRSYNPIKSTSDKIKNLLGIEEENDTEDHFSFIEKITSSTISEYTSIKENINKLTPLLKIDFINQLLRGAVYALNSIDENVKNLGISFKGENFAVVKIHIDDCSDFVKNNSMQEMELVKLVIINVLGELGEKDYSLTFIDFDYEHIVILTNFDSSDNKADSQHVDEIVQFIKEGQTFIAEKCSIYISAGISGVYTGFKEINSCHKEADEALSYRFVKGTGSIIKFSDIQKSEGSYVYTLQTESQLINSIKMGDIGKVESILTTIIDENFKNKNQSLSIARCLFFDVISTAIKVMEELNLEKGEVFGRDYDLVNELMKCQTVHEMHSKQLHIYNSLCGYINSNKKSHNVELRDRIIDFLEENYYDNGLSLVSLSDNLDLNPTYVSYFFKEQVGETFINYLSKLRISKAKDLLSKTNLSVQDIAEKVGYANSGVFIRAFKKFEGHTPGKFR